ncbi:aromatic ring-hydroxylating dioxygenase subunit alpha [Anabaena azotica]|uniref:Rieske 2Fe-2S domain-containing protein n=1 Tax=Anabaena azotica FACHB-119 TaxID=947527 RepID=A0ABR8DGP3_9NOST|nr:Rieske 2Fe-2S domain-containing protein [Anabaena azotica]MBD2504923.1 Rieske 2Fe-2S domain-containing protein [Anabaena azotica FACHB-119]
MSDIRTSQSTVNIESPKVNETEEKFQWTKQWYPIAIAECLDPSKPQPVELLGKNFVLWRDKQGKWNCFEDLCPHRLVRLSEGRVESDGTLLCAYHAWRFNSEGKCVSMPQSKDKESEAQNCASSRSCATAYPLQERQGLLWLWPESGSQALIESKLREPRVIPELEETPERIVNRSAWNIRDLPYGWDYFIENVADPAHVPVSHHNIMGSRYKDAGYFDMVSVRKLSTQEGFSFETKPAPPDIETLINDFQPPCVMRVYSVDKRGCKYILTLYGVPIRPGWTRLIGSQLFVKNDKGEVPKKGLGFFALPMPIWLTHILSSMLLHQDSVFLHYQEKFMAQSLQEKWLARVYTPNPSDKMVITFRQWWEKRAGGEIPWDKNCDRQLPPPEYDKRKLFDVWNTHTKDCYVCQQALKNINRLSLAAYVVSIGCLTGGIIADARHIALQAVQLSVSPEASSSVMNWVPPQSFWIAIVGAVLFALIGYLLKKLTRLFYVYEFEHSHNH